MEYKALYQAMPILKKLEREKQKQVEEYFQTAPLWLLESIQMEEIEQGTIFIRENEPADTIYFTVKGVVEAIDYRFFGIAYEFMRFDNLYAMGGMEYVMDLECYRTTLRTATKCVMAKVSRENFARWMASDIHALQHETNLMANYLLMDGRKGRMLLFLQGANRLEMLFTERFECYAKDGILEVKGTRQNLSNATGLSVKTINRAVKKLEEEGLITRKGNKIFVNEEQYQDMKDEIALVLESD